MSIRDSASSFAPISTSDALTILKKFSMSSSKSDGLQAMYPHLEKKEDLDKIIDEICEFEFTKEDMRRAALKAV